MNLTQIPHSENSHVDALLKLARNKDSEMLVVVLIEHLPRPSTFKDKEVMWVEDTLS